jgi:hypothetical protein
VCFVGSTYGYLVMNYQRKGSYITVEEIHNATLKWIRNIQETTFQEEIKCLTEKSTKKLSTVRRLKLYMDEQNILRCGGKIDNAPHMQLRKNLSTYAVVLNSFFKLLKRSKFIRVCNPM